MCIRDRVSNAENLLVFAELSKKTTDCFCNGAPYAGIHFVKDQRIYGSSHCVGYGDRKTDVYKRQVEGYVENLRSEYEA